MGTSDALREIFEAGRPLVEQWLDIAEQIAALRDTATANGLDWSQVKALLKAQIQDERDDSDGKRVRRIVEKAEFASAYADMLGLGNMNEKNYSTESASDAVVTRPDERRADESSSPIETQPPSEVHEAEDAQERTPVSTDGTEGSASPLRRLSGVSAAPPDSPQANPDESGQEGDSQSEPAPSAAPETRNGAPDDAVGGEAQPAAGLPAEPFDEEPDIPSYLRRAPAEAAAA